MEIQLPDNVVIQCPLVSFAFRKVASCAACQHFKGLSQATVDGRPIDSGNVDDYQVICGKPITRRLQQIIVE